MSVIVGCVLLEVCDGFKFVYCWVFYVMFDFGFCLDCSYVKLVWLVVEIMGNYYLYGDVLIYGILVCMV